MIPCLLTCFHTVQVRTLLLNRNLTRNGNRLLYVYTYICMYDTIILDIYRLYVGMYIELSELRVYIVSRVTLAYQCHRMREQRK